MQERDNDTDRQVRNVNLAVAALIGLFAFVVMFIFFSMEIGSHTSLPPTADLQKQTPATPSGSSGTN